MRTPPQRFKRASNDRYPKRRDGGHFLLSLTKATTGYASGKKELKARGEVDKKRPPR